MTRKVLLVGTAVLVIGGASAGIAIAAGAAGGDDRPLTGSALDRATAAALAHTGGGTVLETEAGDGGAVYGVEVQLGDGTVVEVALDGDFDVIGQESDDDRTEDSDDATDED
jgi:hypothetical protein